MRTHDAYSYVTLVRVHIYCVPVSLASKSAKVRRFWQHSLLTRFSLTSHSLLTRFSLTSHSLLTRFSRHHSLLASRRRLTSDVRRQKRDNFSYVCQFHVCEFHVCPFCGADARSHTLSESKGAKTRDFCRCVCDARLVTPYHQAASFDDAYGLHHLRTPMGYSNSLTIRVWGASDE